VCALDFSHLRKDEVELFVTCCVIKECSERRKLDAPFVWSKSSRDYTWLCLMLASCRDFDLVGTDPIFSEQKLVYWIYIVMSMYCYVVVLWCFIMLFYYVVVVVSWCRCIICWIVMLVNYYVVGLVSLYCDVDVLWCWWIVMSVYYYVVSLYCYVDILRCGMSSFKVCKRYLRVM